MPLKRELIKVFILLILIIFLAIHTFAQVVQITPEYIVDDYKNMKNWLIVNFTGEQIDCKYLEGFTMISIPIISRVPGIDERVDIDEFWQSVLEKELESKANKRRILYLSRTGAYKKLADKINSDIEFSSEVFFLQRGVDGLSKHLTNLKEKNPSKYKRVLCRCD